VVPAVACKIYYSFCSCSWTRCCYLCSFISRYLFWSSRNLFKSRLFSFVPDSCCYCCCPYLGFLASLGANVHPSSSFCSFSFLSNSRRSSFFRCCSSIRRLTSLGSKPRLGC
jgi:hypothetical protein